MNFSKRSVFITGASSGIGQSAARQFAAAGASVALSARSEDKLIQLRNEITNSGGVASVYPADICDANELEKQLAAAASAIGGIDIVIHCAGMTIKGNLEEMLPEDWDSVLDTNLKSTYQIARLAYPYLLESASKQPAKFIAIGSVGTFLGIPLSAAYCASKGGLQQFSCEYRCRAIKGKTTRPTCLGNIDQLGKNEFPFCV